MAISNLQYRETLEAAALDAAKARVKAYNQVNKELSPDAAGKMTRQYFDDFLAKLTKAYPYEKVTLDDLSAIKNYDADKMADYLYQYGIFNSTAKSPTKYEHDLKAADILSLLQGVAKPGEDWMSMGTDKLKKFGLDHGYNVKNKEEFAELLKDIGEQQVNYDRSKLAQEAKDEMGWSYWPRKVIAPSAMQEFENAIATGGDYDAGTAVKMGALDALTNAATWEAPGIRYVKGDIANGILGAMVQAGAEAGRQGGELALSDNGQSFDIAPVVFAGTAGATRPALVGAVQQKAGQVTGETARQFARGVAKATRANDASAAERAELVKKLTDYNKIVSRVRNSEEAVKNAANASKVTNTSSTDIYAQIAKTNDVPEISKLFGVPLNKDYTIDAKKVLAQYDKPTVSTYVFNNEGKVVHGVRPVDPRGHGNLYNADDLVFDQAGNLVKADKANSFGKGIVQKLDGSSSNTTMKPKEFDSNLFELDANSAPLYQRLFPVKYADEMAGSPSAFKNGYRVGTAANVLGSRIEPTAKLGSDYTPKYKKTYKDEKWYQGLNVRSKKVIDEAFKKKEAESEEE